MVDITHEESEDHEGSNQGDSYAPFQHLYKVLELAVRKADVTFEYRSLQKVMNQFTGKNDLKRSAPKVQNFTETVKVKLIKELERINLDYSGHALSGPWKMPYDDQVALKNATTSTHLFARLSQLSQALQSGLFLLDYFKLLGKNNCANTFSIQIGKKILKFHSFQLTLLCALEEINKHLKYNQNTNKMLDLFEVRKKNTMQPASTVIAGTDLGSADHNEQQYRPTSSYNIYHILNKTKTKAGAQLLKEWLQKPLVDKTAIEQRQQIIQSFVQYADILPVLQQSSSCLHQFPDLKYLGKE